jgi:hypothetical protein
MLSLERFAQIRADMEKTEDESGALRRAGLDEAAWKLLENHWQASIARELASGAKELSSTYFSAFFGPSASPAPLVPTYLARQTPERAGNEPEEGDVDVNETAMIDARQVIAGLKLPFTGKRAAPPTSPGPNPREETGTEEIVLAAAAPEPAEDLESSVERYARLVATLAMAASRSRALSLFGLTEEIWERVARTWAQKTAVDSELKARLHAEIRRLTEALRSE